MFQISCTSMIIYEYMVVCIDEHRRHVVPSWIKPNFEFSYNGDAIYDE